VGFPSGELLDMCSFGLWCSWLVLGTFQCDLLGFVKVFLFFQFHVWRCFLFQSLEESLKLPGTFLCVCCCHRPDQLLTVKFRQPSHEFTFGVGIIFVSYLLVLTPVV
jgi:hypothetical protein